MQEFKEALERAVRTAVEALGASAGEVPIQDVPADKPGDYGTPVAFSLGKQLRRNPAQIAQEIVERLELPHGVARAEAVGPYINVFVDAGAFVREVVERDPAFPSIDRKVIVEHTSINPNKEAHVGHLRNIVLGDSVARILRAAGYRVEVQNYIDDTGRQVAESIFATQWFQAEYRGEKKYDHWLGELYVRLNQAKDADGERIEAGVTGVMHRLEAGELRATVSDAVRAMLQTFYALGVEYDLLVWESDIVRSGFLERGLQVLRDSERVYTPSEGKYAGALVMDVGDFMPGLEESEVVVVRSDGNAMYVAKDIGYQFWKVGLFEGLDFRTFQRQPSGATLYTSTPDGETGPDGRTFAHGDWIINVIDVRQSHPQTIVRTALKLAGADDAYEQSHHLAYEVVTLEGQPMSGRKGITLAIDDVVEEAVRRARAVIEEKNPNLPAIDEVARQVGVGALRFAMVKSEAKRIIDFRWEQALSLQGDSAPYVQYAHARARSILRAAEEAGVSSDGAEWSRLGDLEIRLAQVVARYAEVRDGAARELAPHAVAQYALDLATAWNGYYNHRDAAGRPDTQVLKSEPGLREARLALVERVASTLAATLGLLGIDPPDSM